MSIFHRNNSPELRLFWEKNRTPSHFVFHYRLPWRPNLWLLKFCGSTPPSLTLTILPTQLRRWAGLPRVGVFSREPLDFFFVYLILTLWSLRYGFEEQNPSRGIWIMGTILNLTLPSPLPHVSWIVWKNLEEHNSFMRCEKYVDFALPIMEAMVGHGEITQALLTQHQDFFWAIASPVTQFIYITLHPRHDRHSELTPLLEELTREMALVPGCYGGSWGPSIQHDNLCVGVVGWRSIAVCFCLKIILHGSSSTLRIGMIPWSRHSVLYEKSATYRQGLPDFHETLWFLQVIPMFNCFLRYSSFAAVLCTHCFRCSLSVAIFLWITVKCCNPDWSIVYIIVHW